MNVVDMHHLFLLKLKTLDRTDLKDPLSYDIVAILNQAQDLVIDELIQNSRFDLIRVLMASVPVAYASFDTAYEHGITELGDAGSTPGTSPVGVVNLSTLSTGVADTSFRSFVRAQASITRTQTPEVVTAVNVQVEIIPKDIIGDFEINGSNYPIFTNPKGILEGSYLIVMGDYYTSLQSITAVIVRTAKILHMTTNTGAYTTTCELPTHLHETIVDKAVQIFGDTVNVQDLKKQNR